MSVQCVVFALSVAVPVIAGLVSGQECPPQALVRSAHDAGLKVSGVKSRYCIDGGEIEFAVSNKSGADLLIGVWVEKRRPDGTWGTFTPDITQNRVDTRALRSVLVHQGSAERFAWNPGATVSLVQLEPGRYRLMTYAHQVGVHPAGKVVLGSFDLESCPSRGEVP